MIKAIIFDCFGVLVTASFEPFIDAHLVGQPDKIVRFHELDQQSSRGLITYEEQLEQVAELVGISVDQTREEFRQNPANHKLLDYIAADLKPHYKIGFLSNASDNWLGELFTDNQVALFDDIVLSYEHGLAKPDQRLFELACTRLGVLPEEAVMVDDVERYITGAQDAGLRGIVYTDFTSFKQQLEQLLDTNK